MNRQYLNLPNLTQLYFPKHLHKVVDLLYGENVDTYLAIQLFSTTDFQSTFHSILCFIECQSVAKISLFFDLNHKTTIKHAKQSSKKKRLQSI